MSLKYTLAIYCLPYNNNKTITEFQVIEKMVQFIIDVGGCFSLYSSTVNYIFKNLLNCLYYKLNYIHAQQAKQYL